jgi:hypothetical protein
MAIMEYRKVMLGICAVGAFVLLVFVLRREQW